MKGLDIILAMGDVDADMVYHARHHKKSIPAPLKWASIAAILLCALALGAIILGYLMAGPARSDQPDVLAPGTEDSEIPEETEPTKQEFELLPDEISTGAGPAQPEAASSSESAASEFTVAPVDVTGEWITLSEEKHNLNISVPAVYAREMTCDYRNPEFFPEETAQTDPGNCTFRFVDSLSRDMVGHELAGRVWTLHAVSFQEFAEAYGNSVTWDAPEMPYAGCLIGRDDSNYYYLLFPTDVQNRPEVEESSLSYAQHNAVGLFIVRDFLDINGIEENPGWEAYYQKEIAGELVMASKAWLDRAERNGEIPEEVVDAFSDYLSSDTYRWNRVQAMYSDHFRLIANEDGSYWLRCYGPVDEYGRAEVEGFLYENGQITEADAGTYQEELEKTYYMSGGLLPGEA